MVNMVKQFRRVPFAAWLILFAGALRLVNLGQESLWYDESFTAWVAKLPFEQMIRAIQGDVHPPLWYVVEWLNVRVLGSSEFALRLPAALFGVLAVWLVYRLALALGFEKNPAIVAGLLAAAVPGALYYSQDARMYPMLCCFVLAAAFFGVKEKWSLFGLACIGAVYSQNLGVLYVLALGLVVLASQIVKARRTFRLANLLAPGGALGAVVLAWLPWARVMLGQAASMGAGFWLQPLSLGGLLTPYTQMIIGWRADSIFAIHLYTAAISATGIGLLTARRWLISRRGLLLLALVFGAPALAALVSVLWRSVYLPRAFMPSVFGLCLLWAYGLTHLSAPNRRAAGAVLIPAILIGMSAHYFPALPRENVRDWVSVVRDQWHSGDVIYYGSIAPAILAGYYLSDLPYALRPAASDLNQSLTETTKAAMGFKQADFCDLRARRVWLVVSLNPMSRKDEIEGVNRLLSTYPAHLVSELAHNDYQTEQLWLLDTRDQRDCNST